MLDISNNWYTYTDHHDELCHQLRQVPITELMPRMKILLKAGTFKFVECQGLIWK